MKKLEFNNRDFAYCENDESARKRSQEKFDEWFKAEIESAPVVYVRAGPNSGWIASTVKLKNENLTARLVDIRELKKECKHETNGLVKYLEHEKKIESNCTNCGVDLIAEWKVKP